MYSWEVHPGVTASNILVFASKMTEGERDIYRIVVSNEAPYVTILNNIILLKGTDKEADVTLRRRGFYCLGPLER